MIGFGLRGSHAGITCFPVKIVLVREDSPRSLLTLFPIINLTCLLLILEYTHKTTALPIAYTNV